MDISTITDAISIPTFILAMLAVIMSFGRLLKDNEKIEQAKSSAAQAAKVASEKFDQAERLASETLEQSANTYNKSSELLAMLELHKLADGVEVGKGMALISALAVESWDEFQEMNDNEKEAIRMTVAHLNFVATLVFSEHLERQTAWNTYFQPFRLAGQKLHPWWFKGMGSEFRNRYISAQRMMEYVMEFTDEQIREFDEKRKLELDKKFKIN